MSVDAVRFYERRGVLPKPDRRPSGYRIYGDNAVERLRAIKSLQSLGLSLDEVSEALTLLEQDGLSCDAERWRLETVLKRLDDKIVSLQNTRSKLAGVLEGCRVGDCEMLPKPA